ncbi:MAG: glutamate synthase large subunit [Desulfobacterales bacterium]|nr:glutamate synthase large subunit [Desulfobacterales bacterium]
MAYSRKSSDLSELYDPAYEHDACGVGFICSIRAEASHEIVKNGLRILDNLTHRGACGCDETSGDGAGILIQMPHAFFAKACGEQGIDLPAAGQYATGLFFLPTEPDQRDFCTMQFEEMVSDEGLVFLGWRTVPVEPEALGYEAGRLRPFITQAFVGKPADITDPLAFERRLYVIRKLTENTVWASDLADKAMFHICSLSARTMVYKGMLMADQMPRFYPDLQDSDITSAMAVVHQRYSTNTFPTWDLAQPFRFLCHNGEINTLRGNVNWMAAREHLFQSARFGADMARLLPISTPGASDSAILDDAMELLYHSGRSLPHVIMMLIPEAWEHDPRMDDAKKSFYRYHACMMEPWDGPAAIVFTDGERVGAVLDRNGLRPARYVVTRDDTVIMASEAGTLDMAPENVRASGRLQPGRMFYIDLNQRRIVEDTEIKQEIAGRRPYRQWLDENLRTLEDLPDPEPEDLPEGPPLRVRQRIFGYSMEDLDMLLSAMAREGKTPVGSMGDDISIAALSNRPRLLFDYFKQLFAQVTNPPLDAIREELVTGLSLTLGAEQDLFQETPRHCRQLQLMHPVLTDADLSRIRQSDIADLRTQTLSMLFAPDEGPAGFKRCLDKLCAEAATSVENGVSILILSDRFAAPARVPIPSLLATAAVHHHLIRRGIRTRCGIILETGEVREIHHFCCLIGYGAGAVNPYLALEAVENMAREGELDSLHPEAAAVNYIAAVNKGILKVMSKMGISTLQSYRGAQVFECLGLTEELVEAYFTGTATRIGGADLHMLAEEVLGRHDSAVKKAPNASWADLEVGGKYKWRRGEEKHQYNPITIARLQQAVRQDDRQAWDEFTIRVNEQNRLGGLLRGLFDFKPAAEPVPVESVESWTEIVKRFKTGAMSYGSISREAHETLAVAMNRIGGKSNSGEGGEDPDRYFPDENGDWRNSAIKQIASGRFGVTGAYLASAADLQIKMAQGAKPGEGGQLPAFKVYPWVARTRHATPYVELISPPPHHDIYSIEDLAQLIHDLKNANPEARVNVKLVSEVGVGTVAAGVAKAKADVILISGDVGGTGAAPLTSIRHAGLPWELGLAEAQQTLVLNGLRSRVVIECDGQLKIARDVVAAALLGAEEFGFGTIALVALGCIMMRVCHLNTCPVGIATQDPELRKKFAGEPEHVVRLMRFIAEDVQKEMAALGFRSVSEMVGRTDCLDPSSALTHWKARGIDLSRILAPARAKAGLSDRCFAAGQDHALEKALDKSLIEQCRPALDAKTPVRLDVAINNTQRTVGTMLSYEISKRCGEAGLAADTIVINASGTAGQSFCAFGAPGLSFHLRGEGNDYFGKGLCGALLTVRPPEGSAFAAEENIIIGNVAFYGATSGEAFISGMAGERFCVRNSGVHTVVEGVGDHGCEYMTGGKVVVLGSTGRNFAAGMSGGVAYVRDTAGDFAENRCNPERVDLEAIEDPDERDEVRDLIRRHHAYTGSRLAGRILDDWRAEAGRFVRVMPTQYKEALKYLAAEDAEAGKTS